MPSPVGRIVVLNGFPGTGKFTILKRAKELLPADTTCLLDNHLLIDPVVTVIPDRSDEHHELRRMVRAPIFKKLRERAREGYVIFMTACLAENNERDTAFLEEHLDIARGTDIPFFWVNAHCDQKALEQRLSSPERCHGAKTKLTDVCVLQNLLREHSLIEPSKIADGPVKLVVETLDVSGPVEISVSHLMSMIDFPQGVVPACA
ncbi:uncharacterized protein F5Z01DRAFT_669477 [Emericellopsis atlantica]|uniref:Chloramphenicol phosphotransferase n=1 Tax=Emericellopsis atlantica TaxID=2614577 RepID=A0A9P7ZDA6_9HYPO|nr:uncharacterized protein F5Z01DRAFT_669477 [Emericellopsis atlantica]KAG9249348.1 hypothetical protein F5Z01DRAFT_669477 [Emericellopsis atlantica]